MAKKTTKLQGVRFRYLDLNPEKPGCVVTCAELLLGSTQHRDFFIPQKHTDRIIELLEDPFSPSNIFDLDVRDRHEYLRMGTAFLSEPKVEVTFADGCLKGKIRGYKFNVEAEQIQR